MGKPVKLLTVPFQQPDLRGSERRRAAGLPARLLRRLEKDFLISAQGRMVGEAWEAVDDPDKIQFELIIVPEKGHPQRFQIGAHAPRLTPDDIELTHKIWLDIVEQYPDVDFHHRDVVSLALRQFDKDLHGPGKDRLLETLEKSSPKRRARRPLRRT